MDFTNSAPPAGSLFPSWQRNIDWVSGTRLQGIPKNNLFFQIAVTIQLNGILDNFCTLRLKFFVDLQTSLVRVSAALGGVS
jgi:hypothetical protein